MPGSAGLIAIDWGTTNRRIFVLDGRGTMIRRETDDLGVLSERNGDFPAEIATLRQRFGDQPLLLAGMIGSNRGWMETAYLPCPVTIEDLGNNLLVADRRSRIVPGISYAQGGRADVMRGEEIQILGAIAAGLVAPDAVACHPGTHAKWVRVRQSAIQAFRTVMTGELFALLKTHSILADALSAPVVSGDGFLAGVRQGLQGELPADLFSIRANILRGLLPVADGASYASGLLIGCDVRIGLRFGNDDEPIALIGDPSLTNLYALALGEAERRFSRVDGETAFLAGIKALMERIL